MVHQGRWQWIFFLPWSMLGKIIIIIYWFHNHKKRSVRDTWNVIQRHISWFWKFKKHGKEWLDNTLIQITLAFRKSEGDTKAFVFVLYNCRPWPNSSDKSRDNDELTDNNIESIVVKCRPFLKVFQSYVSWYKTPHICSAIRIQQWIKK